MIMKKTNLTILLLLIINFTSLSQNKLLDELSDYISFFEVEAKKENSELWNISFDMPVIIATDSFIVTNRKIESFTKYKNIFYGQTDEIRPGGHCHKSWRGKEWAFFTFPDVLFENKKELRKLFFHEGFHRNQTFLKLTGRWTQCKHLTKKEARSLLKLEYNALLLALQKNDFKEHLTDALTFRAYRYFLFPNAFNLETEIEIFEGLAHYTGLKLSGYSVKDINDKLKKASVGSAQTFAYHTGAIYGFILDKAKKDWKSEITKNDNFLYFTQRMFEIKLPENIDSHIKNVRNKYEWDKIKQEEKIIAKSNKKREKEYESVFFKKPVLTIQRKDCTGYVYECTSIYPFKSGKICNKMTVSGDWGKLLSDRGIFIGDEIRLPAPFQIDNNKVVGVGWTLYLSENWEVKQVDKKTSHLIMKKE